MKQYRKIVLASGSPRRKELLSAAGFEFEVIKSAEDENITETAPDWIVMDLAKKKAESVARSLPAAPDGNISTPDSLSGQRSG
ncbi:MAG: Maf family protein, partial [Lachnospiraceae bacterium]|nr:Maf family protein [Lachnospiraceae bacterium]